MTFSAFSELSTGFNCVNFSLSTLEPVRASCSQEFANIAKLSSRSMLFFSSLKRLVKYRLIDTYPMVFSAWLLVKYLFILYSIQTDNDLTKSNTFVNPVVVSYVLQRKLNVFIQPWFNLAKNKNAPYIV